MTTEQYLPPVLSSRLRLRGITKFYGTLCANDAIDFSVAPGEIHALLGENGAGKSTVVKILCGVTSPDAGDLYWEGSPVVISSPTVARRLGICTVFQHFSLFETLTVAENISLGLDDPPPIRRLIPVIVALSERFGLAVDPQRHVYHLSVGERQRVEILRCLLQAPRLLILDEPTSVLTPQEADTLRALLRRLAQEDDCSVVYITHKLDEVIALCDRATVLRNGRVVGSCSPRETNTAALAAMMVGSVLPEYRRSSHGVLGDICLEVRELSLAPDEPSGTTLKDITLSLRRGQILGIAGVAGNGQKELLAAVSGERAAPRAESVTINGVAAGELDSASRRRLGLSFIPEERLGRGAVGEMSLTENMLLTQKEKSWIRHGLIDRDLLSRAARSVVERFHVAARNTHSAAASLSGGNMQKFIVGREIAANPLVLVAAHPTWGVDIGAALAIRQSLVDLSSTGSGLLIVSEDLGELIEICDEIAVLCEGMLSPFFPTEEVSLDKLGQLMGGLA